MATDPSEFVSIFSPGGTRLTLPPASPAGSEADGVGSAQSSQTPAQQGAAGSVVQKILGGPSGSIGSVGGRSVDWWLLRVEEGGREGTVQLQSGPFAVLFGRVRESGALGSAAA